MTPHAHAERTIAAWYLVFQMGHPRTSLLRPEHFRDPKIRRWWISATSKRDGGWNWSDLGIDPDFVHSLDMSTLPPERQIPEVERRIVADWGKRHLQACLGAVLDDVKAGKLESLEDALGAARVAIGEAESGCLARSTTHREAGTQAVREWAEMLRPDSKRKSVPMPLGRLQTVIGGWMRGKFWGVMAVSSGHKTTLARMSAWNAAKAGFRPLVWTFEDSKLNLAGRTFAAEVKQVDTRFFTAGVRPDGITEDDMAAIFRGLGAHLDSESSERMRYLDESSPRLSRVAGVVSAEVARGVDFVVLDYMQLIRPDKGDEGTDHWKQVSQTLHDLAKDLDVPIVATMQATHAAQNGQRRSGTKLVMNDVWGGAAVVNNLWGMFILNQCGRSEGGEWVKDPRRVEIQTAKNKAGPVVGGEFVVQPERDLILNLNPNEPGHQR